MNTSKICDTLMNDTDRFCFILDQEEMLDNLAPEQHAAALEEAQRFAWRG